MRVTHPRIRLLAALLCGCVVAFSSVAGSAQQTALELRQGDHICYIGNTLADRMQHHAWLETYLHAAHPQHELTFRNLGFAGDEIKTRPRSANFGSPDQWLQKAQADVVFCLFGYNEALRGEAGLGGFQKDLAGMIDGMLKQKYNGKSAPRLVVFSPIAHENLNSPHLPDGAENNQKLALYTAAMREVCQVKGVRFVDLFTPTQALYAAAEKPLTMNGIHLLDHGNRAVAQVIMKALFPNSSSASQSDSTLAKLREAIQEKNMYWFSRYRVVDGYNVYGGRSRLAWHGQSNYDVMQREMEVFDVMTANRDKRIWAVAQGGDWTIDDSNIPPLLEVKTNKPGKLPGEKHPYLGGEEAIGKMQIAAGMQVNLFASEEMFPEMINPVQMAVDTDGRLFVSVWPSYPHWNPTEPRTDKLICLPDEDGDGVADKCVVFADKLNSITGFEFWGGGVLVAAPPEIWFLKDTDGDDRADFKLRMLQGVSGADTHHTANAMVIGPDGGLYWSRGVFHVTNMETPTKTFRSSKTGVYRFDPRTYEIDFHFPIGPNPHGDVFDQWGYQFANDGTSGTGCYVNIGQGVGNKHWFRKRVRPVPATGILSSSHFPERNNGNFLICNSIGFLGVLQHEVQYNGADITAEEIEPILVSSDPNFRPTDLEIGGDGALYVSDWCNVLIGHMQHNIRDPNRDHAHGRIYRVTCAGRPLLKPVKLKGQPIDTVLRAFYAKENGTRYRARLELSGRDTAEVTAAVVKWASRLDPTRPDDAQALLECLWVFEEHRVPNLELAKKIYQGAAEPRVRAAVIRTLGHWGTRLTGWEPTLVAAARDASALVRAEAVKAAVSFAGLAAAEVIFAAAVLPTDPELDTVLKYARGKINVDKMVQDAVQSGQPLSTAAQAYALRNASVADLLKLDRTEAVCLAILGREKVSVNDLGEARCGLARLQQTHELDLLVKLIEDRDARQQEGGLGGLDELLISQPAAELSRLGERLKKWATTGNSPEVRQLGYVAWIVAADSADDAFIAAQRDAESLHDLLASVPHIPSDETRGKLFARVRSLVFDLPQHLRSEGGAAALETSGIRVDYFQPNPRNVARETLAKLEPQASGIVPEIKMDVPQLAQRDAFALRFSGTILVEKAGKYRFSTASDDGSRLYIGDELVVDNDGTHGMSEKSGSIKLSAGAHPLLVTYFDQGGSDGLSVKWSGPGFKNQAIPADKLMVSGGETLHDVAIRTLQAIPGHEPEKFLDLASLIKKGQHRTSAIRAMRTIPKEHWATSQARAIVDNLVAYLSEMPARYRTGPSAVDANLLAKEMATLLPAEQATAAQQRLENLDVRVIAIGTVPHRMIYDKEKITVQAGTSVEFRFSNSDSMPHNLTVGLPGAMEEIGLLAEATARDPDAMARNYVPKSDKILLASRLLQPGQSQALSFDVPQQPGVYPIICTYPGHWRRMYAALYVVEDLETYQSDPAAYLATHELPVRDDLLKLIGQSREWTVDEMLEFVKPLGQGRSFEVGANAFQVASCIACHKMGEKGQQIGPELTKLDPQKQNAEHILRSLITPSAKIEEKYQTSIFELESGKVVTGMILEETGDTVKVIENPLAKADPIVLKTSEIDYRDKSTKSLMPEGLASKLTREEILDLIAYVFAGGDKKHKLFQMSGHEHHKH